MRPSAALARQGPEIARRCMEQIAKKCNLGVVAVSVLAFVDWRVLVLTKWFGRVYERDFNDAAQFQQRQR
jgi:hypothetical protein